MTGVPNPDDNSLKLEFGSYVQVFELNNPSNTTKARTTGAITLNPTGNAQGSYHFMSLISGHRLSRMQWTVLPMPDTVIAAVERMAEDEKQPLLAGGCPLFEWNPHHPIPDAPEPAHGGHYPDVPAPAALAAHPCYVHNLLPHPGSDSDSYDAPPPDESGASTSEDEEDDDEDDEDDEESEANDEDDENIAENNDYDESGANGADDYPDPDFGDDDHPRPIDDEDNDPGKPGASSDDAGHHTGDHDDAGDSGASCDDAEAGGDDATAGAVESRYNLRTGRQRDYSHRLGHQMNNPASNRSYDPQFQMLQHAVKRANETAHEVCKYVFGHVMTQMTAIAGIKKHGHKAVDALFKEFCQLDDRSVFAPLHATDLTIEQRKQALRAINLIKEKRDGALKGRSCADGRPQRALYTKEESASPTVSTDALMFSLMIDAFEQRDVATADVVGAYLLADMDDFVVLKLIGESVDIMCDVNEKYRPFVVMEHGKKSLYVQLKKALNCCVKSA